MIRLGHQPLLATMLTLFVSEQEMRSAAPPAAPPEPRAATKFLILLTRFQF